MDKRIPELDGLRGIAVLMVMLYHFGGTADRVSGLGRTPLTFIFEIGWSGVDLFFVLSGFLITSILLKQKGLPHYFRNFYMRRILRIFPIYYLTITILIVYALTAKLPTAPGILESAPWFYLYLSNWLYAFNLGAKDQFLHLWSLAIEEQFYLVWPLIVLCLNARNLKRTGIAAMIFALGLRLLIVFASNQASVINPLSYFMTFARIDSLMMGALIAMWFQHDKDIRWISSKSTMLIFAGGIIFLTAWLIRIDSPLWNNRLMLSIGFTGAALLAGGLIVLAQTTVPDHAARKSLRNGGLIFFGKYSYALYVFHYPIAFWLPQWIKALNLDGWSAWLAAMFIGFGTTILAALLSWNLIENPILSLKRHFESNHVNAVPS